MRKECLLFLLEKYGAFKAFDLIKQGDVIGFVGNSGNARTTQPHLHYGIYTASGAVNPYPLLSGRSEEHGAGSRKHGSATRLNGGNGKQEAGNHVNALA